MELLLGYRVKMHHIAQYMDYTAGKLLVKQYQIQVAQNVLEFYGGLQTRGLGTRGLETGLTGLTGL